MTAPIDRKAASARVVTCPTCGEDCAYSPANPHRPFCSARCRNNDLGAWASEGYRVATSPPPEDETGDTSV